ncbi:ribosome assembly cofactor RimP [bacterium SCSIO 12741]|nr:ribosome assembly cofactor RimP [bacterium SCSIO 12741]
MITKEQITQLVDEKLHGTEYFVVDITVSGSNKIVIEIDGDQGFNIQECVNVSRHVEHSLDREKEDFELQVSSPGLTKPFKVMRQYTKNVGRKVKVTPVEGVVVKGQLVDVNDERIIVETTSKERVEGKKKKVEVKQEHEFPFAEIKETKLILDF